MTIPTDKTLDELIDEYFDTRGATLWADWDISQPGRKQKAKEWLKKVIVDVYGVEPSKHVVLSFTDAAIACTLLRTNEKVATSYKRVADEITKQMKAKS